MMRIPPYKYIENGDLSAVSVTGPNIDCRHMRRVSLQFEWPSTSTPVGVINVYGSDDPRAVYDKSSGAARIGTYTKLTPPVGSVHGTHFTLATTDITIDGTAGNVEIILENPPAVVYAVYTRTSGGAANGLQARASGNG